MHAGRIPVCLVIHFGTPAYVRYGSSLYLYLPHSKSALFIFWPLLAYNKGPPKFYDKPMSSSVYLEQVKLDFRYIYRVAFN